MSRETYNGSEEHLKNIESARQRALNAKETCIYCKKEILKSSWKKHEISCLANPDAVKKCKLESCEIMISKGRRNFCCKSHSAIHSNAEREKDPIYRLKISEAVKANYASKPKPTPKPEIYKDPNLIPKKLKTLRLVTANVLNKDIELISYDDVDSLKTYITSMMFAEHMSPREIGDILKFPVKCASTFIRHTLGIELRNWSESAKAYNLRIGNIKTDEKERYKQECKFRFNMFTTPNIVGYHLLENYSTKYQVFTSHPLCLHKDHMISISYGWDNKIDSKIISHPANCRIISGLDNVRKGTDCSITLEELIKRIDEW